MEIKFAHICDYALVADNGKLSVLGIFNQLRAPAPFPFPHPALYIAYEIGLEPAEVGRPIKVKIEIQDEDGGEILSMEGGLKTEGKAKIGDTPAARQVIGLNQLVFSKAGLTIWTRPKCWSRPAASGSSRRRIAMSQRRWRRWYPPPCESSNCPIKGARANAPMRR